MRGIFIEILIEEVKLVVMSYKEGWVWMSRKIWWEVLLETLDHQDSEATNIMSTGEENYYHRSMQGTSDSLKKSGSVFQYGVFFIFKAN